MWRVLRAVLAHQQPGDAGSEPANDLVRGIDNVPLLFDFAGLGHVRFHDSFFRDARRSGFSLTGQECFRPHHQAEA
jgi:hypothetical protein